MVVLIVGLGVLATVVFAVAHRCLSVVDQLSVQLGDVDEQVRAWQRAHDHHVLELHRRLQGLERMAVRTADQGLALSGGLTDLYQALAAEVGATEARRRSGEVTP